jgi:hypothetical protein
MNYKEFQRRVDHNTQILKSALESKEPILSILPKIYTYDTKPGELNSSALLRKGHDMLPAAYLGLLANTSRVGADAFKVLGNNHKIKYELKTSEINSDLIWAGALGGLYLGSPGRTTKISLTSALAAQYTLDTEDIIESKNLNTVLMISDSKKDGYITAYELDGETIISYINRTSNKTRDIKLCTFQKHGWNAQTVIPLMGFEQWKKSIVDKISFKE